MKRHPTIKARIPYIISLNRYRNVRTKKYGSISEKTLYDGYFYPLLVKQILKSIFKRLPYKVTIEIDNEKLKTLTENEQSFFKDSVEQTCLDKLYIQKEFKIFNMATQDLLYLF